MGDATSRRRWVALAAVLLVSVQLALRVARLSAVRRFATTVARVGTTGASPLPPDELGELVASVAYRLPGASCLESAVATTALLDAQGDDSDLKIGVRKRDGEFYAHAWVESNGRTVVGGYVDTTQYAELARTDRVP